jgi:hypothetical protein
VDAADDHRRPPASPNGQCLNLPALDALADRLNLNAAGCEGTAGGDRWSEAQGVFGYSFVRT